MFFFISFVLAKNYCVEKNEGRCRALCSSFSGTFDAIFSRIPNDTDLNGHGNSSHNIYVADIVDFYQSKHNIMICDKSIYLTYNGNITSITIDNQIKVNDIQIKNNIPILFKIKNNLSIIIKTKENAPNFSPIYLEATKKNLFLTPKFFTDSIPYNMITISNKSENINVYELTDSIKTFFTNTNKIIEISKTYYCISDKKNKCEGYDSYDLVYINTTSQIKKFPMVLIVDCTLLQFFTAEFHSNFAHIICLPGSDITYYPISNINNSNDFYVIMHKNSIEMNNFIFEGGGKLTLCFHYQITLHSTTKVNNNHFTLKARYPFSYNYSRIYAYESDLKYEIDNKIQVAEYSLLHGDDCLIDLFETGSFIPQSEIFVDNITLYNLREYYYKDVIYNINDDEELEIPKTWNHSCHFIGTKNSNITFNDVYSFDGISIDNFMNVSNFNTINIRPSNYFCLIDINKYDKVRINIQVDHDFIMHDGLLTSSHLPKNIKNNDKCKITGNGTVKFIDPLFMNDIKKFCRYEETINFEIASSYNKSNLIICVGQSDAEKCKSSVMNITYDINKEWIWLRNTDSMKILYGFLEPVEIYLTDTQISNMIYGGICLTGNSHLIFQFDKISISPYEINSITNLKGQGKLTLFVENYLYDCSYKKFEFFMQYYWPPSDFDFEIYFYYEYISLDPIYDYNPNYIRGGVKISGKSVVYVGSMILALRSIFNETNGATLAHNPDFRYPFFYYADDIDNFTSEFQPLLYYYFGYAKNYDEFVIVDSQSYGKAYLYKDINLQLNSNTYCSNSFCTKDPITITIDLPNNAKILINQDTINIIVDKVYRFDICNNFIFNVKDTITLDCSSYYFPKNANITFTSSKKSIEIIASKDIQKLAQNCQNLISVPENLTIVSPVPQYIKGLFNTNTINQSSSWSYLYLSEKGKDLFESCTAYSIDDFQNDENLNENIVLACGQNDIIAFPPNWSKHNVYILQDDSNVISIQPTNLTYYKDGVLLNNKLKIISGEIIIHVPELFNCDAYLPKGLSIEKYMYKTKIICSNNTATTMNISEIFCINSTSQASIINLYNYGPTNHLIIKIPNHDILHNFKLISSMYSDENIEYLFGFEYICFYPQNSNLTKYNGNFYHATNIYSLLEALKIKPNIQIFVGQNLKLNSPLGDHVILIPNEENIHLALPDDPYSILISQNDNIQISYFNSTLYDITRKTTLEVSLCKSNSLILNIEDDTNSKIILLLYTDVIVSTDTSFNASFKIDVHTFTYHLYTENIKELKNVFGDVLEYYYPICAYDSYTNQTCSFMRRDLIDNIFKDPFNYSKIEILPIKNNKEITLPFINIPVEVYVLSNSTAILSIKSVYSLNLSNDALIINEYWKFKGDFKSILIKLGTISDISISEELSTPVFLQLTDNQSIINLIESVKQESPAITFLKHGNEINKVIIYNETEIFNNFMTSLTNYEGITFINRKYLCVCNDDFSFEKCKEGIDGIFDKIDEIISDPGKDVIIRIFVDCEISSNVFQFNHDIFIDQNCKINLTNIKNINQNLPDGIQVDNLIFKNLSNVLLKPNDQILNITLKEGGEELNYSIEIDTFLKLNILNIDEGKINASFIHVSGQGELNSFNYPIDKIITTSNITVIKGVFIICGLKEDNLICSYNSDQGYQIINVFNNFSNEFDSNSKIIVFMDSFSQNVDVNIQILNGQKIEFMKNTNSHSLLDDHNKLRFLSTLEITNKADLTTKLAGSQGGALVDNKDSDIFIVGFNDTLYIKQEGEITENTNYNIITIQPMSEKASIFIDDSVDINKQKLKIEPENEKEISVTVHTNKKIDNEILNEFINIDSEKVKLIIENEMPQQTPNTNSNKFPKGAIAGIVIGAIVVVTVIILIIIFILKKKKSALSDAENENPDIEGI